MVKSIAGSQMYTGDDDEMWTASFLFPSMIELKHSIMSLFPSIIESGVITLSMSSLFMERGMMLDLFVPWSRVKNRVCGG